MKTIEICNVLFEVKESKYYTLDTFNKIDFSHFTPLYKAYANPSITKEQIFDSWRYIFSEIDEQEETQYVNFKGVTAHNTMCFTLGGVLIYKSEKYVINITKAHNALYHIKTA